MNDSTPSASARMPRYVCHKTVHALKITQIDTQIDPKSTDLIVILHPEDKQYAPIRVSQDWCRSHQVERPGGYYVVYEDRYTSWSPIETFEKGFTLITDRPSATETNIKETGRIRELTTALSDISRTLQACVALGDSVLINSEPSHRSFDPYKRMTDADLKPNSIIEVEAYTYYVPPCGCRGFFHNTGCSDQNPLDPFGAISNPDNRRRVAEMAARVRASKLSVESPWVTTLREVLDIAKKSRLSADSLPVFEEAERLLKDGVALRSPTASAVDQWSAP